MFDNLHTKLRTTTDDSALSDVEAHRFQWGRAFRQDEGTEGHGLRKGG